MICSSRPLPPRRPISPPVSGPPTPSHSAPIRVERPLLSPLRPDSPIAGLEQRISKTKVEQEMSLHGQATIAIHPIDKTRRYVAVKYSAAVYAQKFLSDHGQERQLPRYRSYNSPDDLAVRGTFQDRDRFLADVAKCAASVERADEREAILLFGHGLGPWSKLRTKAMQRIGAGTSYSALDVSAARQFTPFHYLRGMYFSGAHSEVGLVLGRVNVIEPNAESVVEYSIIDRHIQDNFILTSMPTEDFRVGQQGVLCLRMGVHLWDTALQAQHPHWSIPYNDSFVCGAIHWNRPIYLASKRAPDNMARNDGSGVLRIFGRELAVIRGSEAYELHQSDVGEVFVPIGAPKGKEYFMMDLMRAVEEHTDHTESKAILSWLHDMEVEQGHVVVQTMERLVDGKWISLRDLNIE